MIKLSGCKIHRTPKNIPTGTKRGTLLLDFDGTLSPIVKNPSRATLPPKIRTLIKKIANKNNWTVSIVSGRDLKTLRKKIRLPSLIYAGNHGYEILHPGKKITVHSGAKKSQATIAELCRLLPVKLRHIKNSSIENKFWSASLHTRKCTRKEEKEAVKIFRKETRQAVKKKIIRITTGKKIWEIRPFAKWDKGRAVLAILKTQKPCYPIYIGDDKTDEDAYQALRNKGLTIQVGFRKTKAHISIKNIKQVPALLKQLISLI